MTRLLTADLHDPWTRPEAWQELAACAEVCADPGDPARPGWWDVSRPDRAEPTEDNAAGLDVCTTCHVAAECLAAADDKLDRFSIRGGRMPAAWTNPSPNSEDAA